MIYLFRIISDEDQEFCRDLVIDGSDTFLEFHHTLQEELGYDPSQLASFFITNDMWEKKQEITLIDMMEDPDQVAVTMDQATIKQHVTDVSQRMIYVYDFFSDRAFFIELLEISDQASQRKTPFVAFAKGDPPTQISIDLLLDPPGSPGRTSDGEEEMNELFLDDLGLDDLGLDDLDPGYFDEDPPEEY